MPGAAAPVKGQPDADVHLEAAPGSVGPDPDVRLEAAPLDGAATR